MFFIIHDYCKHGRGTGKASALLTPTSKRKRTPPPNERRREVTPLDAGAELDCIPETEIKSVSARTAGHAVDSRPQMRQPCFGARACCMCSAPAIRAGQRLAIRRKMICTACMMQQDANAMLSWGVG